MEVQAADLSRKMVSNATQDDSGPSLGSPNVLKEIRIATRQDLKGLYPLISAYVAEPDLALSVTGAILDAKHWSRDLSWGYRFAGLDDEVESRHLVDDNAHAAIEDHVRSIGLSPETTDAMLASLAWKKEQLTRESNPDTEPNLDRTSSDESKNAFTQTAAIILLTLCTNLAHLQVSSLHQGPQTALLQEFLLKNNHNLLPGHPHRPRALGHLAHINTTPHAHYCSHDEMYSAVEFLDYFRYFGLLPALTTYSAQGVMEYQTERTAAPLGTSNVRKLHLHRVDISGPFLRTMMLVPKQLEEFKLSVGGMFHPDAGEPNVHPRVLGEALLEHRVTLKALELDLGGGLHYDEFSPYNHGGLAEDGDEAEWEIEHQQSLVDEYYRLEEAVSMRPDGAGRGGKWEFGSSVGSLRGFVGLRELGISVTALLGPPKGMQGRISPPPGKGLGIRLVDTLPEGLEVLRLFEYEKGRCPDHDEQVRELMETRGEKFPRLTVVEGVDEPIFRGSEYSGELAEENMR